MLANVERPKGYKHPFPVRLPHDAVLKIILALHPVANIEMGAGVAGDNKNTVLMMYQAEGYNAGLYVSDEAALMKLISSYAPGMSRRERLDILADLANEAPVRRRNTDRDLIALNNGIFNYKTKELRPFSPDFVFTGKCHVDFVRNAVNPVILNPDGTYWDAESWMHTLSDDDDVVNLLWQGLGCVVRPAGAAWDKILAPYGPGGCNGKGTYCRLAENLCKGNCTNIALSDFGKEFYLADLIEKSVIICHENETGAFLKDVRALKASVTSDTFQVNRKGRKTITVKFEGIMMQCFNDLPRIDDKSDSIYRRFLWIPFTKSFLGESVERKYIKNDYIYRKEVLEYVLWKVLCVLPDYYALAEPEACKAVLEEFKYHNDPLRTFWSDFKEEKSFAWQLLPMSFLYDLYKAWRSKNNPAGSVYGRNTFINGLKYMLSDDPEWEFCAEARPGNMMDAPEPLILEYDLKDWMAKGYSGADPVKKCMTTLAPKYKNCLRRRSAAAGTTVDD